MKRNKNSPELKPESTELVRRAGAIAMRNPGLFKPCNHHTLVDIERGP